MLPVVPQVFIVQHVDVCMFSNGKFKNVVALLSSQEGCPIGPGVSLRKSYTLRPIKGSTKNWIALEDSYTKAEATLASTVICPGNGPEDRNVFAIYVSYYVKVSHFCKQKDIISENCFFACGSYERGNL